jgi:hypothetical protein
MSSKWTHRTPSFVPGLAILTDKALLASGTLEGVDLSRQRDSRRDIAVNELIESVKPYPAHRPNGRDEAMVLL